MLPNPTKLASRICIYAYYQLWSSRFRWSSSSCCFVGNGRGETWIVQGDEGGREKNFEVMLSYNLHDNDNHDDDVYFDIYPTMSGTKVSRVFMKEGRWRLWVMRNQGTWSSLRELRCIFSFFVTKKASPDGIGHPLHIWFQRHASYFVRRNARLEPQLGHT